MSVAYRQVRESDQEAFRDAVTAVARERRFLTTVDGFSAERVREWLQRILDGAGVQWLAFDGGRVIGWCDVVRPEYPGFEHSGVLGMGVLAEYRRRGIGRALLERTLDSARTLGLTRVELDVFSTNTAAIELYRQFGFRKEGVKRKARILDGVTDDLICMAVFFD